MNEETDRHKEMVINLKEENVIFSSGKVILLSDIKQT